MDKNELQGMLISFANDCIGTLDRTRFSIAKSILAEQLIRSATSAALNYAEAISAESLKDFIHKLSLSLKELRESRANLLMIKEIPKVNTRNEIDLLLQKSNQLISILTKSVTSCKAKLRK